MSYSKMDDDNDLMTDADFEEALESLQTDDHNEVSDLLSKFYCFQIYF